MSIEARLWVSRVGFAGRPESIRTEGKGAIYPKKGATRWKDDERQQKSDDDRRQSDLRRDETERGRRSS